MIGCPKGSRFCAKEPTGGFINSLSRKNGAANLSGTGESYGENNES